ncbi:hypothetical protein [Brevibacterium luteolum]|uniref:hypothetical protein n=1 Tax=Brevibacterium luteolum TaxID=199591 RepID=UPI001FB5FF11|nr:hypothetical protein [Brevibacterium luteolum]
MVMRNLLELIGPDEKWVDLQHGVCVWTVSALVQVSDRSGGVALTQAAVLINMSLVSQVPRTDIGQPGPDSTSTCAENVP